MAKETDKRPTRLDAEKRKKTLFRLLSMLLPWRKWIICSNIFIIIGSVLGVFSLYAILPILQIALNPAAGKAAPKEVVTAPGVVDTVNESIAFMKETAADAAPAKPQWNVTGPVSFFKETHQAFKHTKHSVRTWISARAQTDPVNTILMICVLFGIATLIRVLLDFASEFCIVHIQTEFTRALTHKLYMHFLNHDLAFFHYYPTGALMNRVFNDVTRLRDCIALTYGTRIRQPITLVCLVILLFTINAWLTAVILLAIPILVVPTLLIALGIREVSKKETGIDSGVMAIMQERLSGIRLIKSFGTEEHEGRVFDEANDAMFERRRKRLLLTAAQDPIVEILITVGIICMIIFGIQAVLHWQWITRETFLFFLVVLTRFYKPLKDLFGVSVNLQRPLMSANAVFKLLDTPPVICTPPAAVPFPADWKKLALDRVGFRYDTRKKAPLVVKRVTMKLKAGDNLAIIGHNGSGKSTLAALLCRFYDPVFGSIKFDGIDLRDMDLHDLHRSIGIVNQDTLLFNISIEENIAFGVQPDQIDHDRVKWAAVQAGADAFIQTFPEGYKTPAGPRGGRLSGGQRQLIAMARVFYHNFSLIIYDEPTTHLDVAAETAIMESIRKLMSDRTIILITHNMEHVRSFDRVILMRKGVVVQDTTPDQIDLTLLEAAHAKTTK